VDLPSLPPRAPNAAPAASPCLPAGERQIAGADLQELALSAQPGNAQRRPGPPVPAATRPAHDRPAPTARPGIRRREARAHRRLPAPPARTSTKTPTPAAGPPSRAPRFRGRPALEHPLIDRLDPVESLGDVSEQDLRVIVRLFRRHPGEGQAAGLGPLRQQRRLPITRRRHHRDDRPPITLRQPCDQRRTPHRPGPQQRRAHLRHHQIGQRRDRAACPRDRAACPAVLLAHVTFAHPASSPRNDLPLRDLAEPSARSRDHSPITLASGPAASRGRSYAAATAGCCTDQHAAPASVITSRPAGAPAGLRAAGRR
jgi:hypothetical protein